MARRQRQDVEPIEPYIGNELDDEAFHEWKRRREARAEAKAELIADIRKSAPRVLKQIRTHGAAARVATAETSVRIYDDQRSLRRFAERIRDCAFGRFLSWVYFIGRKTDGAVKIGVSEKPKDRLKEIQVGCPDQLEFIVAVSGDRSIELMLHQAFAPDHMRGEWFRRSEVVAEFIRIVRMTDAKYPRG